MSIDPEQSEPEFDDMASEEEQEEYDNSFSSNCAAISNLVS